MIGVRFLDIPGEPVSLAVDAATCAHDGRLSTDGDSVRCCSCQSQLLMLPSGEGEFRLEWVSPSVLADIGLLWAA